MLLSTARAAEPPTILVLGDSLSAGYGIAAEQSWASLLARRLKDQGLPHRVINASISGETTAGGLSRLPAALEKHRPTVVLIELGANDGLRGLPVAKMRENLTAMVALAQARQAKVLLFEMRIPSNYGPAYTEQFRKAFGEVAAAKRVPLLPFFLMPIATEPKFFLEDGIHPTAAAQPLLLDVVWPKLVTLLRE